MRPANRQPLRPHTLTSLLAGVLVAAVVQFATVAASAAKPNIVLVMADDMGYECVRANGGTSYETPHLDALAETGTRFEHCYSQPICTPSRVQIMTGIYNQRNYVRFGLLHPGQTTFGQLLKRAGYRTCVVGKWQLSGGFDAPGHFGFDEYCLWQLTRRPGRYPNPGLEVNGKQVDYSNGEYGPDVVSDYACDFMQRNKEGPFLLYYPMILPHWPFEPTPDSPDWDPQAKGVLKGQGQPKYFDDMVAYTDKIVGKLVARLDELGIRENTLVLFTGDNGTATSITSKLGDRTVRGGKGSTTDAGTHVPFIANWPGHVPAGRVSQDLVDFSDFLPTLCAAAGTDVPGDLEIDGRSFYDVLLGEAETHREWTYCWYARNGGPRGKEFARTQRFKLYRDGRFVDVARDPLEKRDLSDDDVDDDGAREKLQAVLDRMEGTRRMLSRKSRKKARGS